MIQPSSKRVAQFGISHQHVRITRRLPNFKYGHAASQKTAHVKNRPQRNRRDAKRNDGWRMAMDDCLHVRTMPVNFAMNKTFYVSRAPSAVNRFPTQIKFHDVVDRDEA